MLRAFPIDFIRQIIVQTMREQHYLNANLIGGENELNLFSFYEHLSEQDEVDRFTEMYRDLTNQQNRTGLIANGLIVAPENPTITNINQKLNIPMTFTTSFRCTLENRDELIKSINNMIDIHKGRKVDVAEFDNGKLMKVGTIANNSIGNPFISNGDYIGELDPEQSINSQIETILNTLYNQFAISFVNNVYPRYIYYSINTTNGKHLEVAYKSSATSTWGNIVNDHKSYPMVIFPPEHKFFTKYQVSLSFDSIRSDEPRTLNSKDYCNLSFGGSATISSYGILMGNQLTKLGISKKYIKGETTYNYSSNQYWVEPLEMPNSLNPSTQLKQIVSNGFITNDHIDSATPTLQYSFILDTTITLLKELFIYSRYGITSQSTVSPNTTYEITEIYSCWGAIEKYIYLAKIVDSIDIENTESDTLTIKVPFKVQGEND